jgi:hypothetical protein
MPKKSSASSATILLSVAVGLFLLLSGIQTFIDFNSPVEKVARGLGGLFGTDQNAAILTVVFAVLKLASGAVLIVGPFGLLTEGIRQLAFWIIVFFWALLTIWLAVVGFAALRANQVTLMKWLQDLSLDVAILAALWQLKPAK